MKYDKFKHIFISNKIKSENMRNTFKNKNPFRHPRKKNEEDY